jgi:stage III sporulation protein AG
MMILVGIALIVYKADQKESIPVSASTTDMNYIDETEARIEQMLLKINGCEDCNVTITLSSGVKKEYVREEGNVLVVTDDKGNQSAVVSKEIAPEIAGVTVFYKGESSLNVERDIIQSVSTVLGIGSNKICVIISERDSRS